MASQIRLGAEFNMAQGATVGFLTCMNYRVLDEVGFLSKFFTTVVTAVRLLSCVDTHVGVHVSHLSESLAAETTRMRLLSRVRVHVSL